MYSPKLYEFIRKNIPQPINLRYADIVRMLAELALIKVEDSGQLTSLVDGAAYVVKYLSPDSEVKISYQEHSVSEKGVVYAPSSWRYINGNSSAMHTALQMITKPEHNQKFLPDIIVKFGRRKVVPFPFSSRDVPRMDYAFRHEAEKYLKQLRGEIEEYMNIYGF